MSEEYIIVGVPHQRRPEVSHVFDSKEAVVEALLEHWVDDDYDLSKTDFDDAVYAAGRDYNRLEVMTKAEVIERIKSHNAQGHQGIELLTELKKVADVYGWRTHKSMYSDREIASNRALWDEYVDPDGITDDDEWDDSTVDERMDEMQKMFTNEETEEE